SRQQSAHAEEPVQTTCQIEETPLPVYETGDAQSWISHLAKQADARSSFNELLDTPIDFSNFIMHRLNVDTLTPDLLAGPTYELMKGSCSSLTELEYHLEEVYKAITDQLDWVNLEGQQYPHNLLQPLPLIPDNRGRRQPIDYNKHALWGVSHWGLKRKQFYGYTDNRESARDVYSKRRIIAVTELQIMEWHDYKHLDWISIEAAYNESYGPLQHPEVPSYSLPPTNFSMLLIILLVLSILSMAWIMAAALIRFPSLHIGPVRIWLGKVEPLLVAFDSQLKIFYTSLDDDASCEHPKRDVKSETFLNCQIRQLSLYKK
nr:hypothetical protein [Tanacetum cinerariifolium]